MNNSRNERREQVREIPSKNPQLGDNDSMSRSNSGPAQGSVLKLQYKTRVSIQRRQQYEKAQKLYNIWVDSSKYTEKRTIWNNDIENAK